MSHIFEEKKNNFMSNYKIIQNSETSQVISSTSSWTDLTGSEISYTPALDSDFIIYEYVFTRNKSSSHITNIKCKLLYSDDDGSSWSDYGNNTNTMFGSIDSNVRSRGLTSIKLCLDNWGSSSKKLKLWGLVHNGNVLLHKLTAFLDVNGSTGDRFIKPYVLCYSVRN